MYFKLIHSIYCRIESALLWYNIHALTIKGIGLKINPYGRFLSNKIIDRNQFTLVCYVGNNKLSHVDPKVVTNILNILKGNSGDILIIRGIKHSFLVMNITIRDNSKV